MKIFVNTLLATLIAGIILFLFQEKFSSWITPNSSPLKAEMYIGGWHDFPDENYGSEEFYILKNFQTDSDILEDFAVLKLSNNGTGVAREARFNFEHSTYGIIKNRDEVTKFTDVEFVELPDLPPGGTMDVYLWSIYGFNKYRKIESFSTMGPYKIRKNFHNSPKDSYTPRWLSILLKNGGIILLILLGIIVIIYATINEYYQKAIHQILSDDDVYLEEKIRLDDNSGKYVFDINKIDKYQKANN